MVRPLGRYLDLQSGDAGAQRVVLECHRGAEQSHQPVASELVDGAAVTLHHGRGTVEQLVHDLLQPLGIQRGRQLHRTHHVGEQHGDLFMFTDGSTRSDRRTAAVAEPSLIAQISATRRTQRGRPGDLIPHRRSSPASVPFMIAHCTGPAPFISSPPTFARVRAITNCTHCQRGRT